METRRMCPHCRAFITTSDRVCPYCGEKVGSRAVDVRNPAPIAGGLIPHAHFATMLILLVNAGLYIATVLYSMRAGNSQAFYALDVETLINFGATFRRALQAHQYWRLVTAGFLHGGLLHIGMNSWVLFDVGRQVEEIYGTSRFLVFYFLSTVCGFYVSSIWNSTVSVGASAGLMGLIGAMIALGIHHKGPEAAAIRGFYIRWVIYMLIMGLLPGLRVDNAAHIGGLAGGFGAAFLGGLPRRDDAYSEKAWRIGSYFCIFLAAVSFFKMYQWLTGVA